MDGDQGDEKEKKKRKWEREEKRGSTTRSIGPTGTGQYGKAKIPGLKSTGKKKEKPQGKKV